MPKRSPWTCVLWDVDGRKAPTRAELVHWIGPPMYETFQAHLGMSPAEATEAVSFYRTLGKADGYTTGAKLFPGVAELIADIAASSYVYMRSAEPSTMNPNNQPVTYATSVTGGKTTVTASAEGKTMPSMKTLRLSATPSWSVSSRMRMRLLPAFENPRPRVS